jgi:hypothetical protein
MPRLFSAPTPAPFLTGASNPERDQNILVVDDDAMNRMITTRMVAKLGYMNVTAASDGIQAIMACARCKFDLILMDCDMPIMNGLEATRQLRASGFTAPVIAFTSTDTPDQRVRCVAAGMTDFLPKPTDLFRLGEVLEESLLRRTAVQRLN